jgi:hypothetical protein
VEGVIDWIGIIVAGLAGTLVITVLMYAGPMMGMPKMDMAQMIGPMILPQGSAAFALGMMMHFVNGIIFAIIYALVWDALNIAPNWWTGLIFGAVHFVVAAIEMGVMPMIHKEVKSGRLPSPMSGGVRGMVGMLLGHLVFGLVVAVVYRPFVI